MLLNLCQISVYLSTVLDKSEVLIKWYDVSHVTSSLIGYYIFKHVVIQTLSLRQGTDSACIPRFVKGQIPVIPFI